MTGFDAGERASLPSGFPTELDAALVQALRHASDGFVLVEEERLTFANDAFRRITGYTEDELRTLPAPALLAAPDPMSLLRAWQQRLVREDISEISGRVTIRRKDGDALDVDVTVLALRTARPRQYAVFVRDPLRHPVPGKAPEVLLMRLGAERAWLQTVLAEFPAGILVAEAPSGKIIKDNEQVREVLGGQFATAASNLDDYSRWEGYHTDGRRYRSDEWPLARAIQRGETVTNEEIEYVRADGTRGVVSVHAAPVRDRRGRMIAAVSAFYDVTSRKRAERMLRFLADASNRLASSLDYATTIATVHDLAVPALAGWCALHLLSETGVIRSAAAIDVGRRIGRAPGSRPEPSIDPLSSGGVAEVLRSGHRAFVPEATAEVLERLVVESGYPIVEPTDASPAVLYLPMRTGGRTFGVVTLVAGAGQRYDSADLELAEEFAHRVAASVENALLYQAVQQSLLARDEFLAAAAHDLRNPLAVISGHVQLLRRRADRATHDRDDRLLDGLRRIEATVHSMTSLLNELLDLTRIQTGRPLDLHRTQIDLVALARRVVALYQQSTFRGQVRVEADEEAIVGLFDESRIERVLGNLLSNAIKYGPKAGDVVVTVGREDAADGPVATLVVRDHGVGIPAEDLPHIFERFYRGHNVSEHIRGAGIGLAGSRQIVEQHGGTLTVASREGEGSVFTVRLPLTPPATA